MNRERVALLVILVTVSVGLAAAAQPTDVLRKSGSGSDCTCPKEGCGYEGTINGEEDGIKMVIEVTWVLEGDELIKGKMHSNPSLQGMTCEYYRPFEIAFDEALREDEYPKLKKKMEKKLANIRGKD